MEDAGLRPDRLDAGRVRQRQKDDLVYWKQMIEYTGVKLE